MPRKSRTILAALGVAGAAALAYLVAVPRPVLVEIAKTQVGTFQEIISSDGILRSKDRRIVAAFADGDIKRVPFEVGDPVKKGQAITELYWDVKYEPVKSPIDGVISKVYRETAGPIHRGEPIVEVVDPTKLEAVADLLTTDAVRVKAGNPATISVSSDEPSIPARVTRVSKAGFTKESALGVEEQKTEITMDLIRPPRKLLARLGSTYHVEVSIEVARYANATVIPAGALFRDGPDWAVYVVRERRARKTKVTPKAFSGGEAMIGEGLAEGDPVVVFPGDLIKDGTRVKRR